MCCECGGGLKTPAVPAFDANEMCCACGGGREAGYYGTDRRPDMCTNTHQEGANNTYGLGCDSYQQGSPPSDQKPGDLFCSSDLLDDDDFVAETMCCACHLPASIEHKHVGSCKSAQSWEKWSGAVSSELGEKTADDCWTDCQASSAAEEGFEPHHQFWNDGENTRCYCQLGCPCMEDVGEGGRSYSSVYKDTVAFVEHKNVGWCSSPIIAKMWDGDVVEFEGDKTADDCWTACQAPSLDIAEPRHRFWNDGVKTLCYCQDGCPCMADAGDYSKC